MRTAFLACTAAVLGGCQVLGAVYAESTLRAVAIGVLVAAVIGFIVARMRR